MSRFGIEGIKSMIKQAIKKAWLLHPRMTHDEFLKLVEEAWSEHQYNEYSM